MAAVELPTETLPTVELPNPVIMPDMDFSKNNFNEQMEAAKNPTPGTATETPEATPDFPPTTEPKTETKVEPEAIPEKGTTDDTKVETTLEPTPAARANLPEELITGKKSEPKADEAVETLLSAEIKKGAKQDAIDNFKSLRDYSAKIIQERNDRIAELESKSSDGSTKAEIESAQARVTAAETRAKELESTIERIAFTESPRFKQMLNDEVATLTTAKTYLEGTEINPDIIDYAARLTGSKRIQVLTEAGADPNIIAAVSPYLAQFDNIQRHKGTAIENWKVEAAQQSEQYKAQQEAQVQQRRKAEDDVWAQVVAETANLVPYRKFDKNDSWNSRAEELDRKGKTVYNGDGVDLKEVGMTLRKGVAYDALEEVREALTEEVINLRKENARLKSAKPGASNGQTSVSSNGVDAHLAPLEQSKSRFNQEMAKARGG